MPRRIILFELNEVPWKIVDHYVADHPGSALAGIVERATCFTSMAADRGHLSPWTTWPTLHRGVNDEMHMIASFGRTTRLRTRPTRPSGHCCAGSMSRSASAGPCTRSRCRTTWSPTTSTCRTLSPPSRSPFRRSSRRSSSSTSRCPGNRLAMSTPACPSRRHFRF